MALVFVLQAFTRTGRLDSAAWQSLREASLARSVDHEIPAIDAPLPIFPRLTPAGVSPEPDADAALQREHV